MSLAPSTPVDAVAVTLLLTGLSLIFQIESRNLHSFRDLLDLSIPTASCRDSTPTCIGRVSRWSSIAQAKASQAAKIIRMSSRRISGNNKLMLSRSIRLFASSSPSLIEPPEVNDRLKVKWLGNILAVSQSTSSLVVDVGFSFVFCKGDVPKSGIFNCDKVELEGCRC